jgi:hypothetical protein
MKKLRQFFRRLVPLRPANTTPRVVLERTIDQADQIKAVLLVVQMEDGTIRVDWSAQTLGTLVLSQAVIQEEIRREMSRHAP